MAEIKDSIRSNFGLHACASCDWTIVGKESARLLHNAEMNEKTNYPDFFSLEGPAELQNHIIQQISIYGSFTKDKAVL